MSRAGVYEVTEVGPNRLAGEVVRVSGDLGTIQVYESTAGLKPGHPVYMTGRPLSVLLGPGLIGSIYDGIQRPLKGIAEVAGAFIPLGEKIPPLDIRKKWSFEPKVEKGQAAKPGDVIGVAPETPLVEHRVLAPPDAEGEVIRIAPAGEYTVEEEICVLAGAEGERSLAMAHYWPAREPRPYAARERVREPLITGIRVIDMMFPLGKGGAAMIPGGFGTGKTMTQQSLAKWSDADVIVYIGCGERGNEMTDVLTTFPELTDPRTGHPLLERTLMIANTSNMPVAAREVSIYTGITMAEYYRDMGYDVAVMADSTSRWAEALRELSGRLEEMPAEEGYPAYLPTRLAQFYERAGAVKTLSRSRGSVSIVGAVSPMGGDFSEPVTQHTKRFVRCFWALDTELASARHYPAIHWLNSYTEYVDEVADWWEEIDPDWRQLREEAIHTLQREARLQQIVKLVGPDVLPDSQRLILLVAELIKVGFLAQNAFDEVDMFCVPRKQARLLRIILGILHRGGAIVAKGAPLHRLARLGCMSRVRRAKSSIPNDQPEGLAELERIVQEDLDGLEREFA